MWEVFLWKSFSLFPFPKGVWKSYAKSTEGLWIKNALFTRLFRVFHIYFPLLLLLLPNILFIYLYFIILQNRGFEYAFYL